MAFIVFMLLRSFGGCLLHAAASAWTGYGIGKTVINRSSKLGIIPFYLLACFMHGFYNLLVSFDFQGVIIGFILAFSFVGLSIYLVRNKIKTLDMMSR